MPARSPRGFGTTLAMLAAAASAHFVITALGWTNPEMRRTSVLTSIALTDDAGGSALFPSTALAPNQPVSRCVQIGYSGSAPADDPGVRLAARDLRGTLVSRLTVAVEVGTGGGSGGCTGFHGDTVFRGPLARLGTAEGIATGWTPSAEEMRTYRITVTLDAGASAGRATATLEWLATSTATPKPEPTTEIPSSPSPTPSTTPAVLPAITVAPVVPTPPAVTAPTTAPTVSASPGPQCREPSCGEVPPPEQESAFEARAKRVIQAIVAVAQRGGRDSRYPATVLIMLGVFVLVQRRIDLRDPKLALAPLADDRYVYLPGDGEQPRFVPRSPAATRPPANPGAGGTDRGEAHGPA